MTFREESNLLDELIAQDVPIVSVEVRVNAPRSLILAVDYAHGINQAVPAPGVAWPPPHRLCQRANALISQMCAAKRPFFSQ